MMSPKECEGQHTAIIQKIIKLIEIRIDHLLIKNYDLLKKNELFLVELTKEACSCLDTDDESIFESNRENIIGELVTRYLKEGWEVNSPNRHAIIFKLKTAT